MQRKRTYYRDWQGQLWLRDYENRPVRAVVSNGRVVPESCWICRADCSGMDHPPLSCPYQIGPEYEA